MSKSEVVFATADSSVHLGSNGRVVTGRVLKPGDYLDLSQIIEYQQEAIKEGKVPGLEVLTETQAKRKINTLLGKSEPELPEDVKSGRTVRTKTDEPEDIGDGQVERTLPE